MRWKPRGGAKKRPDGSGGLRDVAGHHRLHLLDHHFTSSRGAWNLAGAIQTSAIKINGECAGLESGIRRLLDEALAALAGRLSRAYSATRTR
jgi:hypothetical protein